MMSSENHTDLNTHLLVHRTDLLILINKKVHLIVISINICNTQKVIIGNNPFGFLLLSLFTLEI